MALQYAGSDRQRSVVLAYRLGKSDPQQHFKLRGLAEGQKYRLTRDGQVQGELSGKQLALQGLLIGLAEEWRASVIELEAVR